MKHPKSALVFAACAASLLAGGFSLEVGNPLANPEAKAMGAVLLARVSACESPEKTTLTATAEGMVNGKRQTIDLKAKPLSEPGMVAFTRDWPKEGTWAIRIVASNPVYGTYRVGAIVPISGDTLVWAHVRRFNREPLAQDADALLQSSELARR